MEGVKLSHKSLEYNKGKHTNQIFDWNNHCIQANGHVCKILSSLCT